MCLLLVSEQGLAGGSMGSELVSAVERCSI